MMVSLVGSFNIMPTVEEKRIAGILGAGVPDLGVGVGLAMLNNFATVPRLSWCSKCYAKA